MAAGYDNVMGGAARVAAIVEGGAGGPFETGGRVIREWISIPHDGPTNWHAVTEEAFVFAESRG